MRAGGKKINADETQVSTYGDKAMNRSMKMEQLLMKNIMRLVVAGSVVAIAINFHMMLP
jgi:hypothetical protein